MPATNVWDETRPLGSELASTIDDIIRQLKLDIRERMAVNFVWNVSQAADGQFKFPFTVAPTAVNTSAIVVTGYSLTGADVHPMLDLAGTWNTSGAPSAIKLNILDTASNAGSLLLDLQTNSVSRFNVSRAGAVSASSFTGSAAGLTSIPAGQLTGTITSAVQDNITRTGTVTSGVWNAGAVTSSGSITLAADGGVFAKTYSAASNAQGLYILQPNAGGAGSGPANALIRIDNRGNNDAISVDNNGTLKFVVPAAVGTGILAYSNATPFVSVTSVARGSGSNYLQFNDPTGAKGYVGYTGADDKFAVFNALNADMTLSTNATLGMTIKTTGAVQFPSTIAIGGTNVTDGVATPTITSGFGTGPSIAGKTYAFRITVGSGGSTVGVVNFGMTFTNVPIVVATTNNSIMDVLVVTTSGVTLATPGNWLAGDIINVLVRGY